MNIAIIGDGRMGQAIAALAAGRGHTVTRILGMADNIAGSGIDRARLGGPDVAVEFTQPDAAAANVVACARAGIPVVVGTTGWYDQLEGVLAEVRSAGGTLFWAPNFSLGVAVLMAAVEAACAAIRDMPGFDVHLLETHHAAKKDRPSGTAASIAQVASAQLAREIPITSVRTGHVPGTHELVMDAAYEQVRLVHEARDRRVFAEGAIVAAEWLQGRKGIFTMRDVLRGRDENS
jgi:4-hydroxy-tetrahydrodipicolinate reductase